LLLKNGTFVHSQINIRISREIKKVNVTPKEIIESAQRVINQEGKAILELGNVLNDDFVRSVEVILRSKGRVVLTGIGKSANIANKIVATLNSTGTPAVFMHAADAIHGDLGMIQKEDVVIALSKSGNTPEIQALVPLIKNMGNKLIAITASPGSDLGLRADCILHTPVTQEACPNNLAPTTSTTAQLVMGDALAVALLEAKQFSSADFARVHPGGSLGKRLYVRVSDLFVRNEAPRVTIDAPLQEVILEISGKRLGMTAVLEGDVLRGIITDGDLRRMLEKDPQNWTEVKASDVMTANPATVQPHQLAAEALELMEQKSITQLIVTEEGAYKGVIHIHDILKEGIY
jgi:arabinose-5-phosphate isomerase